MIVGVSNNKSFGIGVIIKIRSGIKKTIEAISRNRRIKQKDKLYLSLIQQVTPPPPYNPYHPYLHAYTLAC